jgi:hypothetical protein
VHDHSCRPGKGKHGSDKVARLGSAKPTGLSNRVCRLTPSHKKVVEVGQKGHSGKACHNIKSVNKVRKVSSPGGVKGPRKAGGRGITNRSVA